MSVLFILLGLLAICLSLLQINTSDNEASGHRDPIQYPNIWLPAKDVLRYPGLDHLTEAKLRRLHKTLLEDDFRHLYFRESEDYHQLPILWNLPVVYDWYHSDRPTHRSNLIQRQHASDR